MKEKIKTIFLNSRFKEFWLKHSSVYDRFRFIFPILLFGITFIVMKNISYNLLLDKDQQLYLFSCNAQIVASLFGLSFTAYIFREDYFNKKKTEKSNYSVPVERIKRKCFNDIVIIAIFCAIEIFVSIYALCSLTHKYDVFKELNNDLINFSCALFVVEIGLILKFSVYMINPTRIDNELDNILMLLQRKMKKDEFRDDNKNGDVSKFLLHYNTLIGVISELVLDLGLADFQNKSSDNNEKKFIGNKDKVKALYSAGIISKYITSQLISIIDFRNKKVHNSNELFFVSDNQVKGVEYFSTIFLNIYNSIKKNGGTDTEYIRKLLKELNNYEEFSKYINYR